MKVAIVTGASSGMGREIARILSRQPDVEKMIFIARREDRLRDLAAEVMYRVETKILAVDLSDPQAIAELKKALTAYDTRVTWLVNAAGFGRIGHFSELSTEDQMGMVDVNCRALTAVTRIVLPYMHRDAHIVNLASAAGFLPQPRFAVYAASKSYVLSFSRAIGKELAPRGIAVTAVCPGPVDTEFFRRAEKTGKAKSYKKLLMADCEKISRGIIRAAQKGKSVYVPTLTMKAFRIASKLPHGLLLRFFS